MCCVVGTTFSQFCYVFDGRMVVVCLPSFFLKTKQNFEQVGAVPITSSIIPSNAIPCQPVADFRCEDNFIKFFSNQTTDHDLLRTVCLSYCRTVRSVEQTSTYSTSREVCCTARVADQCVRGAALVLPFLFVCIDPSYLPIYQLLHSLQTKPGVHNNNVL